MQHVAVIHLPHQLKMHLYGLQQRSEFVEHNVLHHHILHGLYYQRLLLMLHLYQQIHMLYYLPSLVVD